MKIRLQGELVLPRVRLGNALAGFLERGGNRTQRGVVIRVRVDPANLDTAGGVQTQAVFGLTLDGGFGGGFGGGVVVGFGVGFAALASVDELSGFQGRHESTNEKARARRAGLAGWGSVERGKFVEHHLREGKFARAPIFRA